MSKPKIKLGMKAEVPLTEVSPAEDEFGSLRKLNEYMKEIVENNVFFMIVELLKKISQDYVISHTELESKYLSYFKNNLKNSNLYCEVLAMNLDNLDLNKLSEPPRAHTNAHSNGPFGVSPKVSVKAPITVQDPAPDPLLPAPDVSVPIQSPSPAPSENSEISETINTIKCYARTANGSQCSRKKQKGVEFCGSHIHSQPYGRIDQPCNIDNRPKKRGRPPMSQQNTKQNDSTVVDIVAQWETIDGIDYIVDNNTQKIYRHNNILPKDAGELRMDDLKLVGRKLPDGQVTWYSDTDITFLRS